MGPGLLLGTTALLGLTTPGVAVAVEAGPTPVIRGTAEVGQNLTAVVDGSAPGRWRWLRCPAAGDPGPQPPATVEATCTPIEEAGGSALYVVRAADLGSRLRVLARYDDGAVPSAATAVVQAPLPRSVTPPALTSTGVPAPGTLVTWTVGRWANTTALDVIVLRCRPDGGSCLSVSSSPTTYAEGQTAAWTVRPADAGHVLVLAVQAQGDESTRARSGPTAVVPSPLTPATPPVPPPPPPTGTPPAPRPTTSVVVAGLQARLDVNIVRLTWRAPAGRSVVVVRRVGRRPAGPADGKVVYRGRARTAQDAPRSVRRVWYAAFLAGDVTAARAGRPAYASLPRVVPRLLAPLQGARTGRTVRLAWRPLRGARSYNVQVWNRQVTRRIATRWPQGRALTLRLPPGAYRWYVYPGYGPPASVRYGALLGQGSFSVRRTP